MSDQKTRTPRILIACEYSGIVSQAFERQGFDVVSCDYLPRQSSGTHYRGDVFDIINEDWTAMIAFPPCTYLAKCQLHMKDVARLYNRRKALEFVDRLYNCSIPLVAIENPIGHLNTNWKSPDQITSPHYFESPYSKEVCLFLKGLPPLIHTCVSPGRKKVSNHVNSRMTQEQKSTIKSKFFPELAQAMAIQWSYFINEEFNKTASHGTIQHS